MSTATFIGRSPEQDPQKAASMNRMASRATVTGRSHNGLLVCCRTAKYKMAIVMHASNQSWTTLKKDGKAKGRTNQKGENDTATKEKARLA